MLPSIKTLREVFGDNAKEARRVLEMSRAELMATPAGAARVSKCYNPPATSDIRMSVLSELAGTHGVMIVCDLGVFTADDNARDAINRIISWHINLERYMNAREATP
jgi:hypothetical protein